MPIVCYWRAVCAGKTTGWRASFKWDFFFCSSKFFYILKPPYYFHFKILDFVTRWNRENKILFNKEKPEEKGKVLCLCCCLKTVSCKILFRLSSFCSWFLCSHRIQSTNSKNASLFLPLCLVYLTWFSFGSAKFTISKLGASFGSYQRR